jgi:3-oxoadipate enol-lactonase
LNGRNLYYDVVGPEQGPTVCLSHALAADGGRFNELMLGWLASHRA